MGLQWFIFVLILVTGIAVIASRTFWLKYNRLKKELDNTSGQQEKVSISLLQESLNKEQKLNEELAQREEELTSNEEELRQSLESQRDLLTEIQIKEASLKALINNTNDLIFSFDKNYCLVDYNNSAQIFYKSKGALFHKGVHMSEFVTPKNMTHAKQVLDKVIQGEFQSAIFDIVDPDGSKSFFESSYNPIRNEKREVIGISVMIKEVTERVKGLQALKASEEKYSKAFKSSPDSVLITAVKDSRLVELNEGFLAWSGYTREEVEGKTTIELGFWYPEERALLKQLLIEHGRVVEMEVHLRIKSGEVRDCLISAETIEVDGELCLISVTRDITYKKKNQDLLIELLNTEKQLNHQLSQREEELTSNEEELRQSLEAQGDLLKAIQIKEASLSALINNTSDIIFSLDKTYALVEFNQAAYTFYHNLGKPLYKGLHTSAFLLPSNYEKALPVLEKVMQGEFHSVVFDRVIVTGERIFFETYYNPIRDKDQNVFGVSVMIRDVTERMRAEKAVMASEEKFSKAFKSSPDAVIITSVENGKIVDMNEGFLAWSGYTQEEVTGRTTMDLGFWDPLEREALKKELRAHGRVIDLEVHLRIKSGEVRDCQMSAETIEIEGELCFVSITRDVTYKKKNQELLIGLLNSEKQLNYELSQREEELSSSEEELRQSFESQSRLLEEIQLKEANVSALMNNTKDLIYSCDTEFRVVEFNASIASFFRKRGIELYKGMPVQDFVYVKNRDGAMEALTKAMEGIPNTFSFELSQQDERCYFEGAYNPIVNEQKEILGVSVVIRDITERKKVEDALRISEGKYSIWFRSSPDSMVVSTVEEGVIIDANDTFLKNTGRKLEEVIGKISTEIGFMQHTSDREKIKNLVRENGGVANMEMHTKRRNGEKRIVLVSAAVFEMQGKECLITTARDITQLKKAEEEIRLTSDRLKAVIDNIPVAIWALDTNGIITLSEGKALADMGLKPGEHVGMSVYDIYNENPEHTSYIKPVLEQGITHHRSDKIGEGYYDEIITPIRAHNGEIIGLIGVSMDVTEVKKKENELRENEALLNNIIDHLPIGLQIFDRKGYSVKMNEAQQHLLGLKSKDDGIGKFNAINDPITHFIGADKLFEKAFKGEIVDNIELPVDFGKLQDSRYNRRDRVWFNLWLYPLFNHKNEVVAIINLLSDITERKRSEEQMEQKQSELIQVNKMMADYKLMALRSAMNPHFIFNAMNSIQYFISKNERENALVYLSLFSKLIRNILNGTIENKITIHREMETLQNYIELENLRFDMKFDVEYVIDEELDIRQIEIPSLLLQPYVENAILHGLYNKTGKGKLKIKIVSHNENAIIFVVEDDGVGREEAKRIKQASQIHNHKSVGMVLTKERLDIINKTNNISVDITDLKGKDGKAAGTRIEIYVEI